jgi:hypothetical protein
MIYKRNIINKFGKMLTRFIPQIKIERREKNVEVVVLSKFSRKREVGARMKQAKKVQRGRTHYWE